jgi:hypothetical protein
MSVKVYIVKGTVSWEMTPCSLAHSVQVSERPAAFIISVET